MNIYNFKEEKQKRHRAIIGKRRSLAFPPAGMVEDNLRSNDRIYRFNAECYKNSKRAIQIWHDIWLPKSQIKIVWGDQQIDYVNVQLSVPSG